MRLPSPRALAGRLAPRGIRARLLFWAVGITAAILAVVIGWNYRAMLGQLEGDAQRQATAIAQGSAGRIDAELGALQGLVQGMASALEAQGLAVPFGQVRALLATSLAAHGQIYGIAVVLLPEFKPAGWPGAAPYVYRSARRLAHADLAELRRGYFGEDWFYLPRYLDRGVWSEPYLGPTGVNMVTFSLPIHLLRGGKPAFAGVISVDIELGWLDRALAELPVGEGGYGLLMTGNGTFVSHPMHRLVLNETIFSIAEARQDPILREVGQRMVSGKPGLLPWVSWAGGEESWLAWSPLQTTGWIMATVVSQSELRREIHRFTQGEILVGLLGLGLLTAAIGWLAHSITRPVRELGAAAATLATGDLDAPLPKPHGRDELAELTAAFQAMRDDLRRHIAELAETTAARERMNGELRIAHGIQMDLIPKTFPAFPERDDLDLFAVMEPAREVGGDFYDFFAIDPERLVIAIADVSGKGVPAALLMAVTRSFLRAAFRADANPGRALGRVNNDLAENNDACMFVTLFAAVVNLADGWVDYANAGHNPPLLLPAEGEAEWIGEPFGLAAGAFPDTPYATGRFRLAAGARLLLYTDGVNEAMNPANQPYGNPRLAERLRTFGALPCRACLDALLADIRLYAGGADQSDDITMLMIRRIEPPPATAPQKQWEKEQWAEEQWELANRPEALNALLDRVDASLAHRQASSRLAYSVRLVLEELLTNILKFAYGDGKEHLIHVAFSHGPPARLRIEDDGLPFDPTTQAPEPPLDTPAAERPIGGLGLHMVRAQTASMAYRRIDGNNRLDIVFREEARDG